MPYQPKRKPRPTGLTSKARTRDPLPEKRLPVNASVDPRVYHAVRDLVARGLYLNQSVIVEQALRDWLNSRGLSW